MSGENLEAVYPPELRCQSQEAMLKAEFEEASRITPPPTEGPANNVKCPANCVCEVRVMCVRHCCGVLLPNFCKITLSPLTQKK